MDLALNTFQTLMCHETKNKTHKNKNKNKTKKEKQLKNLTFYFLLNEIILPLIKDIFTLEIKIPLAASVLKRMGM